jgi:hypothetical protein
MSVLHSPVARSGWQRARGIAFDLLIATVLLWTLPLLLGAVGALVGLLLGT